MLVFRTFFIMPFLMLALGIINSAYSKTDSPAGGSDKFLLNEDFESYSALPVGSEKKVQIAGQGFWRASPYGRKPANIVVKSVDPVNPTNVLASSGTGDHNNRYVPDGDRLAKILGGRTLVISFLYRVDGGPSSQVALYGGVASEYNPAWGFSLHTARTLRLTVSEGADSTSSPLLPMTPPRILRVAASDGTQVEGIDALETGKWHEVRVVFEKNAAIPNQANVTVIHRNISNRETAFKTDFFLNRITVNLSKTPLAKWTGFNVRLDGDAMMDNLTVQSVEKASDLPGWMPASDKPDVLEPILDHIAPPREAISLAGIWEYCVQDGNDFRVPGQDATWRKVLVPDEHRYSVYDKHKVNIAWFRKTFTLPKSWPQAAVDVVFERVCDVAEVYVNGTHMASTDDGYFPVRVNLSRAIQPGSNTLLVGIKGRTDITKRPVGWPWFYPRFSGMTGPVHLEHRNALWISDVYVQTRLQGGPRLKTQVTINNDGIQDQKVVVDAEVPYVQGTYQQNYAHDFRHTPKEVTVKAGSQAVVDLEDPWDSPSPRLWWPHDPHLYFLEVKLRNQTLVDAYKLRFGFRELQVQGHHLKINDRRYMHRRSSIISYPFYNVAENTRYRIEKERSWGYVGSRLHGGPSFRILRVADEMGWLVSPESGVLYPHGDSVDEAFWPAAQNHLMRMVTTLRNHPSVVYWCVSNEFGSTYMPQGHKKSQWVDAWLNQMGQKMMSLDPTRIFTCSGDLDLRGLGAGSRRGPAPISSYHYPWQPYKLTNMLPITAYWLDEERVPWQGVLWKKEKPLMLSEDLHLPYSLHPPHGLSEFAGDRVYDPVAGQYKAIFDVYRMLAEGYYHAQVAGWNPWGVPEPVYAYGQIMPDYLIATREFNRTFSSGEKVKRTVFVYNQLFKDLQCQLTRTLACDGKILNRKEELFVLNAGDTHALEVILDMPATDHRQEVDWNLSLAADGKVLTQRHYNYTVFPADSKPTANGNIAVWAPNGQVKNRLKDKRGDAFSEFKDFDTALKCGADGLVLAECALTPEQGRKLEKAVTEGLRVLWIEVPADSWLPAPLRLDTGHFAAHAFIRSPNDPVMAGLAEKDLQLWRPDGYVMRNTFYKPTEGAFDILADAGGPNGLKNTPLVRIRRGKGNLLLCQMQVLSAGNEPAAQFLLGHLLESFTQPMPARDQPVVLMASMESVIRSALKELAIPFKESTGIEKTEGVLLVDASKELSPSQFKRIHQYLAAGNKVLLQRLCRENADHLQPIIQGKLTVNPSTAKQVIRSDSSVFTDGLSNDDLYWVGSETKTPAMLEGELSYQGTSNWQDLTRPAGLGSVNVGNGSLVISQIRWDQLQKTFPAKSRRVALALLGNLGTRVIGDTIPDRRFTFVDLTAVANRGFEDKPDQKGPRGWFAKGPMNDLKYFPVNRTGLDPVNHCPQPLEPFPEVLMMGGIAFKVINPQQNGGKSCLILEGKGNNPASGTVKVTLDQKATRIWMAGGLEGNAAFELPVASVTFVYTDGTKEELPPLRAGVELNSYVWYQATTTGLLGWVAKDGKDHVLYVWSVANPHANKVIKELHMATTDNVGLALVAMTVEQLE